MTKVEEIMTSPVVTVTPDMPVREAASLLSEKDVSGAPVVDQGKIVGVFSEADVLRSLKTTKKSLRLVFPSISSIGIAFQEEVVQRELLEAYEEVGGRPVREVMSTEVHTVDTDITLKEAVMTMVLNDVNRLPVMRGGELVGIVTRGDVIKGLAQDRNDKNSNGLASFLGPE
ncbi:MAG: CBS domain-containing protein [Methanobacteriota archaeon]|nr:MAG: CBS domain-containing protein [Euryarchaeota archaeon]